MPSTCLAAHGPFRIRKSEEGGFNLVYLSYSGVTISGLPRIVAEDIIEQFFTAEDALAALCRKAKN